MRKLGLFCGTFNPIHTGHLLIAECARDQFDLDKIFFVTSPQPPHRQNQPLLDAEARHEMVSAAVADNPCFEASRAEIDRMGLSYTIDTVDHFSNLEPDSEIALIVGGDNLSAIVDWHRADELLKKCLLLVAPRLISTAIATAIANESGSKSAAAVSQSTAAHPHHVPGARIGVIDFPGIAVSASSIRKRIKDGHSVLYMVPPAVNNLLRKHGHYLDQPTTPAV